LAVATAKGVLYSKCPALLLDAHAFSDAWKEVETYGTEKGSSGGKGSNWRSSKTGRYVTPKYGKSHPATTEREKRK
jgi:hypothetical protein